MNKRFQTVLIFAVAVIASACSDGGYSVPVAIPAQIVLKGGAEIIINDVVPSDPGNSALIRGGQVLADMLRVGLAESNFKIVDRNRLAGMMAGLRMGVSDLAGPEGQAKLGKIMTGSVLVSGRIDRYDAGDRVTSEVQPCTGQAGGGQLQYRCHLLTRTARSTVTASFDVIDLESARILKTKVLTCRNVATTRSTDREPDEIDLEALRQECARQVAADLGRAFAARTRYVGAFFKKDASIPDLEAGIGHAQAGDWDSAIAKFRTGIAEAASNPEIEPEAAARAHWNLGLALELTGSFDDAIAEIRKAYQISPDKDYLDEIDNIGKMKADRSRFE